MTTIYGGYGSYRMRYAWREPPRPAPVVREDDALVWLRKFAEMPPTDAVGWAPKPLPHSPQASDAYAQRAELHAYQAALREAEQRQANARRYLARFASAKRHRQRLGPGQPWSQHERALANASAEVVGAVSAWLRTYPAVIDALRAPERSR